MSSLQDKPKYSVLVIGKVQAGKSALIEHIKNFANPKYDIDRSLLGNGTLPKTKSTRPFVVNSTLPVYEAYRKESGKAVDLDGLTEKYNNEEDYRDFLLSREEDIGIRMVYQDPHDSSEGLEFHFVDTPGLARSEEEDRYYAENIVTEIIATQSFSMILILDSFRTTLSRSQQHALEYFADAFQGLHSRIVFLHTNVEYANIHPTNTTHHLNMRLKNEVLSKMFRRFDSESVYDEENIKEYPSFTIDLGSWNRPIINCLIRKTIRDILKLATVPPIAFRARTIPFPPMEQINILVIGDVQSGKTSLVENFKLYADPDYVTSMQFNSEGSNRSAVGKVTISPFFSDLHTVEIRKLTESASRYDVVDLEEHAKKLSEEDFTDLLYLDQKKVDTVISATNDTNRYRFNIYEGPYLNESAGNIENIFRVHKAVAESKAKFHLVLFTLGPGLITADVETTIKVYCDIFSDLSPLFLFVHTKIDYRKLHVGNKQFHDSMKERQELLQRYTKSSAALFLIDCNLQSKWPVQRAKTQNVISDILKIATTQAPIGLKSFIKKTPKMVLIDTVLKSQVYDAFEDTQKEITRNNEDFLELHSKIRQLDYKARYQVMANAPASCTQSVRRAWHGVKEFKPTTLQKRIFKASQIKDDFAYRYDMEVLFKDKYTIAAEDNPDIHSRILTFRKESRIIEKVYMVCKNVKIELTLGGVGSDFWMIIYRRKSGEAASLMVKLYAKKLHRNGNPVGETKEMTAIRLQGLELEKQLTAVELQIRSTWHIQKEYNLLRHWISRDTLPRAVKEEFTKAEVYEAKKTSLDKIKEIYLKSGGVYDMEPSELAEDAAQVTEVDEDADILWDCKICNETGCNKPECRKIANVDRGSVLMFGKTQAGKSTFIEFVKSYADPEYRINESRIGTGFRSKTGAPVQFVVKTNLPAYEVIDSSGARIDIGTLGDKYQDPEDYMDALNDRNTTLKPASLDHIATLPRDVVITFLDTPGIEDTNGRDVEHAPKIIEAMVRVQEFNLIIVVINCEETPSISHQLAFNYYSKVIHTLQGHHSNIVFLYTHADYKKCHSSNADHLSVMELRHKAFSQLFRCQGDYSREVVSKATVELYPMYNIDCDKRQRPIVQCMRLMTLRELLERAVDSPSVVLDTSPDNLERIEKIPHPDKLNQMQRKKILETTRAILEQQEECGDVFVMDGEESRTRNNNSKSSDECGVVDCVDTFEDCEEYFRGVPLKDFLDSADE